MGIISKFKEGLRNTKDAFTKKLESIITGTILLDDEFLESLEEILITSDMGYKTSSKIIEDLKNRIKGIKDVEGVKNVLKEVLIERLDNQWDNEKDLFNGEKPSIILIVGVNGVGKTTTIGKLSNKYKKDQKKVILAAGDTFRAAAIEQLEIWANRTGAGLIKHTHGSNPAAVIFDGIQSAKAKEADILICDTAGRLHNKKNLMYELSKIKKVIVKELPTGIIHTYLVLDATTGQNALSQAKIFNEVVDINGIIITKLDGTARGGIVFSIREHINKPVIYIGLGEGIEDLQQFDASSFVDAIIS